jgi:magnesium and cobalt transporter
MTSWIKRLTARFPKKPKSVTQLLDIIRRAHQEGLVDADSLRMIEGVIQVSDTPVGDIMISRSEMYVIQKDMSFSEILQIAIKSAHSRFPVIGDNKDEVIGIMLAKDLLNYLSEEKEEKFNFKDFLRPCLFIPESKRLGVLLNEFRKNRNHIAIVVDEYGGVSGLVTIEDVLEQIVGEIEDEHDYDTTTFIRKHKNNYYTIKAITPIEEFNAFFHTHFSDEEFDTIGGLILQGFGRLPKPGESITIQGIPFKVVKSNNRRIQILQTPMVVKQEGNEKNS